MRVLFGLNNEDTVQGIVKQYEETYREKIEYKNVYYFKQAIQELSTNSYDRLVLLEDLEKYPNNNYAQIDEFLFKNMDTISDEMDARDIIYVASDRRKLGDAFLTKLFNLGIYSVLTGSERTKSKLAAYINVPKQKKDVKKYYEGNIANNAYEKAEVSEVEIQRILTYYKNQKESTDKYVEIFDKIAIQYTNEQLRIIINFLPTDVKQYLENNSDKYNEVLKSVSVNTVNPTVENTGIDVPTSKAPKADVIERIVVKQNTNEEPVYTQVMEKEVVRSVYEVPKDYKKIVCFVGAPKVGTTFCINAISTMLYKNGVKVGIVDLAHNRDSYTLYTYDNEGRRAIAAESLKYASNGINEPLVYGKLSVYTGVPGEDRKQYNVTNVVQTTTQNNNVVLVDCDFSTPIDYYRLVQEIYIIQDMDVLNINQITLFLRELKNKGIPMSKIRVIINKHVKCALTSKDILDGIATYSSPDLKMYDELFTSSQVQYYILPFDQENYTKYVEMMFKYSNTFSTFSKEFRMSLQQIVHSIYPIISTAEEDVNTYTKSKSKYKGFGIFKKAGMATMKSENSGYEKVIEE